MLRLNMSFIENDENDLKLLYKLMRVQTPSYSYNINVTYLYADSRNLQNTNICQTTYNTLSNSKIWYLENNNKCH